MAPPVLRLAERHPVRFDHSARLSSPVSDSVSGLFKISTDALNDKIRTTDRTIERYERGIESYRLNLETRFTAMERMVAQLQAQGNYLGSIFLQ